MIKKLGVTVVIWLALLLAGLPYLLRIWPKTLTAFVAYILVGPVALLALHLILESAGAVATKIPPWPRLSAWVHEVTADQTFSVLRIVVALGGVLVLMAFLVGLALLLTRAGLVPRGAWKPFLAGQHLK